MYNVEKYLKQCLDSVINQTFSDMEIICVDDCSTDSSLAILKEYAQRDSRIKIIEQSTNQGQSVARNVALEVSTGEYISFLDSDDWIETDFYEDLITRLERDNSDIAIGEMYYIFPNHIEKGGWVNSYNFKNNKRVINSVKDKQNIIYGCTTTGKVYKSELIKNNNLRFPEGLYIEDVFYTFIITILSNKISLVRGAVLNYRQWEDSTMQNAKGNRIPFDIFKIYDKCEKFLKDMQLSKEEKKQYKKILDNFEIFNIYAWLTMTGNTYVDEFLQKMKDKFKTINIKNNKYINKKTKLIYKATMNSDNVEEMKSYIDKHSSSIWQQIFSIKNAYRNGVKYKVITILGIKIKFKRSKNDK